MAHHHSHPKQELSSLTDQLRQQSRKITGPRKRILDLLRTHPHPMTNKEVYEALGEGCDLATVYRSMHLLQDMGLVKRFDFGDGVARFEMVCGGEDDHHHHLICRECSKIVELDECFPSEFQDQIASASGYRDVSHKLEFFGICPACQS